MTRSAYSTILLKLSVVVTDNFKKIVLYADRQTVECKHGATLITYNSDI